MKVKLCLVLLIALMVFNIGALENPKKPYRAMLFSALVPGGGQFYNEAYIKTAVVIGLQSYIISNAIYDYNKMEYYKDRMDGSGSFADISNRANRDSFKDELRSDYWWIGTVMLLSVADAFVDAHLFNFNSERDKVHLRFEDKKLQVEYKF
jgi:hypothetical protein